MGNDNQLINIKLNIKSIKQNNYLFISTLVSLKLKQTSNYLVLNFMKIIRNSLI